MARPSKNAGAPSAIRPRCFFCAVAGVTFEGRQRLIRRHCRAGDSVWLEPEPDNPHSETGTAVGVWARKRAWIFRGWVKVGHIPHEHSIDISPLLLAGWRQQATISRVVGGDETTRLELRLRGRSIGYSVGTGERKSLGLRLQIELQPDETTNHERARQADPRGRPGR